MCCGSAARRTVGEIVRAGAATYDRRRDLPGLIKLDPFAPVPDTAGGVENILGRLESALRTERNRARSGHWTYDLNRHIALRQAWLAETDRLAMIQAGARGRRA